MMQQRRYLTLLEVMIGIALLTMLAGAVFWRLDQMMAKGRFDSDVKQFQGALVSARSLAMNTKMDFQLKLQRIKDGWRGILICREDPRMSYPLPRLSSMDISLNQQTVRRLILDFYSTGFVGPRQLITFSQGSQRQSWHVPSFFYKLEEGVLPPPHPSELS